MAASARPPGPRRSCSGTLAGAALKEMCRLLPPHVAVHSLRTFLLADACARTHGTAYDRVGLLAAPRRSTTPGW
ncbi:hypothetical protein LV779_24475 [Streptomyces thinghirensis]|nr:hypothetical protein [Streptomyces thinghirensis]